VRHFSTAMPLNRITDASLVCRHLRISTRLCQVCWVENLYPPLKARFHQRCLHYKWKLRYGRMLKLSPRWLNPLKSRHIQIPSWQLLVSLQLQEPARLLLFHVHTLWCIRLGRSSRFESQLPHDTHNQHFLHSADLAL